MKAYGYDEAAHRAETRDAYDRLAPVWSATTDEGPFNGGLERPALRSLVPQPLAGLRVLDAGCGSGAQSAWLLQQGADVVAGWWCHSITPSGTRCPASAVATSTVSWSATPGARPMSR